MGFIDSLISTLLSNIVPLLVQLILDAFFGGGSAA